MGVRPARAAFAALLVCAAVLLCAAGCATGPARTSTARVPAAAVSGVFSAIPGENPALTVTGGAMYLSWYASPAGPGLPRMVLARIDVRTGAIAARNAFSPGLVGAPLSADGWLWVTDSTALGEFLLRLDPATLMVTGGLRFSDEQYPGGAHVAYAGGWLWLDGADQLLRVSPSSIETTADVRLPGAYWSDVGATADGSVLVDSEQGVTGAVQRRNPDTGALLAAHPVFAESASIDGFADSGVWITEIGGSSAFAELLSTATMTVRAMPSIPSPNDLSVRVADGVLWVTENEAGGPARDFCADPGTGRRLATLPITSPARGWLLGVDGGLLYYSEPVRHGTGSRVVPVPVPAACG